MLTQTQQLALTQSKYMVFWSGHLSHASPIKVSYP